MAGPGDLEAGDPGSGAAGAAAEVERTGRVGDAVARPVHQHDRAPAELGDGLLGRAPRGQPGDGRHRPVPGGSQGGAGAHRVADEAHRGAEAARELVQRPLNVADGIAVVVADHPVAELGDRQAAAAARPGQVGHERKHAQRGRAQVRVGRRALRLAAVHDQGHAARLAPWGDGDQGRGAVEHGSGDRTGGVHERHSHGACERIARAVRALPVRGISHAADRRYDPFPEAGGQKMSSKSSAIGKGILIGAAAGVALYVIWRRSREKREVYEAPEPAPEAAFTPAEPEPEPVAEVEPEPVVEPEPEPVAVEQPEPAVEEEQEPVAAALDAAVEAPPPPAAPIAEHGRRQPITYAGRPRDLSPAGWPQPMPLAASGGLRRPAPVSARATWPGVAGSGQMRPTPFRRLAPRGGAGLHRTG